MKKYSPAIIEIVIDNENNDIFVCIYDFTIDYLRRSNGSAYTISYFDKSSTYNEIFAQLKNEYEISSSKILYDVHH